MSEALLTIFSAPKPFVDAHIAVIQRNAIISWTKLPDVKVILFGDEVGLAEIARELDVQHIREIPRSPSGAPRMDAMFQLARQVSSTPLYCIVNADIILFEDIVEAARLVMQKRKRFVMLGQRWDMDIRTLIRFEGQGWQGQLKERLAAEGALHRPAGSDYFLFPAECYGDLPAFVIGRAGWDNWMIYQARRSGFAAIDCTADITIIHQNHDYAHLPGGQPHYKHPETGENIRLAGGRPMTRFTLLDTDYRLVGGEIGRQKMDGARLWRQIEAWPLLVLGKVPAFARIAKKLSNLLWRLGRFTRSFGSRQTDGQG